MKLSSSFAILVLLLAAASLLGQTVPELVNYQGRLTDDDGLPIDGSVKMVFRITDMQYDQMAVSDEAHTLYGTTSEQLTNDDLVSASETVTDLSGNTVYTNGVDYFMDYLGGSIQRVGSGSIPDPGDVLVDYTYNTDIQVLWSETHSAVDVDKGIYQVILGGSTPLSASVFTGGERYLEVNVDGEFLEPRQRITSIPFALMAENVPDGSIGTAHLADNAVTSAKILNSTITGSDIAYSTITGTNIASNTITEADIADQTITYKQIADGSITGDQIKDGSIIADDIKGGSLGTGQIQDIYVLNSGDTVTGDLQVDGQIIFSGDLTVWGGHIGLATAPDSTRGILNSTTGAPAYGAMLHGTTRGVTGAYSFDPDDHFGFIGSQGHGVFGKAGNNDETGVRYGGQFYGYSQGTSYGAYASAYGYGSANAYGLYGYGYGDSASTGNVFGGHFSANTNGSGKEYGIYANGYDYSAWLQGGMLHVGDSGTVDFVDSVNGDGDLYVEDDLELDGDARIEGSIGVGTDPAASYAIATSDAGAQSYGAYLHGNDYGLKAMWSAYPSAYYAVLASQDYGVYGYIDDQYSGSKRIGGKFYVSSGREALGVEAVSVSSNYLYDAKGIYAEGSNSDGGVAYGGHFLAYNTSNGIHYGVMAEALQASTSYGVYALAQNANHTGYGLFSRSDSAGVINYGIYADAIDGNTAYGLYARAEGAGNNYGVYAEAEGTPGYGVYGTGISYGVWGANSNAPNDNYGYLGSSGVGVYGCAGTSADTYTRNGGSFRSSSSGIARGVLSHSYGYGEESSFGVLAEGYNYGTGNVYGGYFITGGDTSGIHYGIQAIAHADPAADYAYGVYGSAYGATLDNYAIYATLGEKNWVNPDPEDPTKSIVYATLEGGENGTYYRGTARLENGRAVVELPAHFRKVTSADYPVTAVATPVEHCNGLVVVERTNERIVVEELLEGNSSAAFDFIVMGKRFGYEKHQVFIDNVDYIPFQGNLSGMDENSMTTQEWYDRQSKGMKEIFKKNGLLKKDGKVNQELFAENKWKIKTHKK